MPGAAASPLIGSLTTSSNGLSSPNLATAGVRWAWDPISLPFEWLPNGQNPGLYDNPSTPQKFGEDAPVSPELNDDDETPPKGLNLNLVKRETASLDLRSVATPQGFSSGIGGRTKVPVRKDVGLPTARSPERKAKPRGRSSLLDTGSLEATMPSLSLPASDSTTRGPSAPRGVRARDAFWVLRGEARDREMREEVKVFRESMQNNTMKEEPVKEVLREFSVTAAPYGREAALHSLEELPASLRNALLFIRNVAALPCTTLSISRPLLPPARSDLPLRPTLVLDLDETLVHCRREGSSSSSRSTVSTTSPDLVVTFDDQPKRGSVGFRPHVKFFLETVSKNFEVVVFTASQQSYADKVLNALDPQGKWIEHRLYRCHCTELRGAFFKELGLLGRPLNQCILVDNSPISVACNADNSVLIRSWYGDQHDQELLDLIKVLQETQAHADCSTYLRPRYGLGELFEAMRASVGHHIAR